MGRPKNLGIDLGTCSCRSMFREGDTLVSVPLPAAQLLLTKPLLEIDRNVEPLRLYLPSPKQRLIDRIPGTGNGPSPRAVDFLCEIFAAIRDQAADYAGTEFSGAVISYGAGMSSTDCAVVSAAAAKSGFRRLRLVSDAVAAANSYCFHEKVRRSQSFLIYSEGYMGADAAVVRSSHRGIHEIAADSDSRRLGARYLDEALLAGFITALGQAGLHAERDSFLSWIKDVFAHVNPGRIKPSEAVHRFLALLDFLVLSKESIGEDSRYRFSLPWPALPSSMQWLEAELDGGGFSSLMQQHNQAAIDLLDRVLESNALTDADIHRVLLVGGMTHQPTVIRAFVQRFGPERVFSQSGLAIVEGNAIIAHELTDEDLATEGPRVVRSQIERTSNPFQIPPSLFRIMEARPRAGAGVTPVPPALDELTLGTIRQWLSQGERRNAVEALAKLKAEVDRLLERYAL
jgi:hypothetical protein